MKKFFAWTLSIIALALLTFFFTIPMMALYIIAGLVFLTK